MHMAPTSNTVGSIVANRAVANIVHTDAISIARIEGARVLEYNT
jgi:hypothetical protein